MDVYQHDELTKAFLLSVALHLFVLALQFGVPGAGLPWFSTFNLERRANIPTLNAFLRSPSSLETPLPTPPATRSVSHRIQAQTKVATPPERTTNPPVPQPLDPLPAPSLSTTPPALPSPPAPPAPPAPASTSEVSLIAAAPLDSHEKGRGVLSTPQPSDWQIAEEETRAAAQAAEQAAEQARLEAEARAAQAREQEEIERQEQARLAQLAQATREAAAQAEILEHQRAKAHRAAQAALQAQAAEAAALAEKQQAQRQAEQLAAAQFAEQQRAIAERLALEHSRTLAQAAERAQQQEQQRQEQARLEAQRQAEQARLKAEAEAERRAQAETAERQRQAEQLRAEAQAHAKAQARAEAQARAAEQAAKQAAEQARQVAEQMAEQMARPMAQKNAANSALSNAPARPAALASGIDLASRALNMARSGLKPSSNPSTPLERRRGSLMGGNAENLHLAFYGDSWRQKVERIGELNFPQLSKYPYHDDLVIVVRLNSDGSLAGVRIKKSSGQPELDAAAIRIVEMSAPFAAFPPDLQRAYDEIEIQRTWRFVGKRLSILQ